MLTEKKKFRVKGGKVLSGTIYPQGSKNEAFMIINGALLVSGITTIKNVPKILDIDTLFQLLRSINVKIDFIEQNTVKVDSRNIDIEKINSVEYKNLFKKIRGGVSIAGALLSRFKKTKLYAPGGDKIGRRKLDTHIEGFKDLGIEVDYNLSENSYAISGENSHANNITLDEASQTGTVNVIFAAVLTKGTTTIYNAACEPNVQQVCHFLNKMGAKISGISSNLLTITGVDKLNSVSHTILPDSLEVGSFMALSVATKSSFIIKNAGIQYMHPVIKIFKKLGIYMEIVGDDLILDSKKNCTNAEGKYSHLISIADAPWPGFPADLISPLIVASIFCERTILIHQKMYESRLFFTDNLIEMGAKLVLCDPHRVIVVGSKNTKLRSVNMSSPDIRAGISLLIAALSAKGTSEISNIEQIKRGYEDILTKLKSLGAEIEEV